jgi:eukaryotic-like serine/threonine-protein kinase
MTPLAILKCIAKASLKAAGRYIGFGGLPIEIAEEAWKDWHKEKAAAERRAELQALVAMAAGEFRRQVDAVVQQIAASESTEVRDHLSAYLQQVPELARSAFRRPDDQQGNSVPPGFQVNQASDLVPFLSFNVADRALGRLGSPEQDEKLQAGNYEAPQVTLKFEKGHRAGNEVVFSERSQLFFGRGETCNQRIPKEGHGRISRTHCLCEIVLPKVVLRDYGSLNGTFVNGQLLGKRPDGTPPDPGFASQDLELKDGDEVRLADQFAFRVSIRTPAVCGLCGAAIAVEQKAACAKTEGRFVCLRCQSRAKAEGAAATTCFWCQKEMTAVECLKSSGVSACVDCQGKVEVIFQRALQHAQAGQSALRAIKDYTVVEQIGQGGMGAVYLVRHQRTREFAAIKVVLPDPDVLVSDRNVERFQNEIRSTMSLHHRNVVRFLDHGHANGAFFMVLEYCDGRSVIDLMRQRGGPLSVDDAWFIMEQALDGLEYAHNAALPFVKQKGGGYGPGTGMVHRDLKPANLFLSGRGSSRIVKVGDFGLAKAFDEAGLTGGTCTGQKAGTAEFVCRQQVADFKRAKAEVDVWAMAAIFYFMLTGKTPRDFPEGPDPWFVVLEKEPVPILHREPKPKIPPKLAEVIDHALREEPEIPFQTASALKNALEECF